jgi:hypothetical protein
MSMRPTDPRTLNRKLILVGAAVIFWVLLHAWFPDLRVRPPSVTDRPPSPDLSTVAGRDPRMGQALSKDLDSSPAHPTAFEVQFKKCFPTRRQAASIEAFLNPAIAEEATHRDLTLENIHIQSGGHEQRMMIQLDGSHRPSQFEVQTFDVDGEGLAIPRGDKRRLSADQLDNARSEFVGRGPTTYHQSRETIRFNGGVPDEVEWIGQVEWIDGKIHDVMLSVGAHSFFCRSSRCVCR